jgi:hypothetical protein
MRSFILACITAVLVAAVGAVVLDRLQEPVDVAFSTQGARP